MPRLNVIVASTRPGRVGRRIGDWFVETAVRHGVFDDVRLVDLAEVGLPFHDEPHHPAEGRYVHRHTTLNMVPVNEAVTIFLRQALDDDGRLVPDPGREAAAELMLDGIARLSAALAPIRVPA